MFTTRPDTLFGFSFLAISIDHPISKFYEKNSEFIKFKNECSKIGTTEESIAQAEKLGFKTNLLAINPLDKSNKVPVYFANFVLWIMDLEQFLDVQLMIRETLILQ